MYTHTHTHTHTRSTWTQPKPTKKVPLGHLWITSLGVMTHELFDSIRSPNTTAVTLYFLQHTSAYVSISCWRASAPQTPLPSPCISCSAKTRKRH